MLSNYFWICHYRRLSQSNIQWHVWTQVNWTIAEKFELVTFHHSSDWAYKCTKTGKLRPRVLLRLHIYTVLHPPPHRPLNHQKHGMIVKEEADCHKRGEWGYLVMLLASIDHPVFHVVPKSTFYCGFYIFYSQNAFWDESVVLVSFDYLFFNTAPLYVVFSQQLQLEQSI